MITALIIRKNWRINGTEEIDLVTSTLGPFNEETPAESPDTAYKG